MQIQCQNNRNKQSIGQSLCLWCNSIILLTEPDLPVGRLIQQTTHG